MLVRFTWKAITWHNDCFSKDVTGVPELPNIKVLVVKVMQNVIPDLGSIFNRFLLYIGDLF